jgi:hypothetical protein
MAGSPASDALAKIIADGAGVATRDEFHALKAACEHWKADDFDAHQRVLRLYYEGKIAAHLLSSATARFPHTAARMPLVALNWGKHFAQMSAAVYDYPPTRYLARDGDKLDPDDVDEEEDEQDAPKPKQSPKGTFGSPAPKLSPGGTSAQAIPATPAADPQDDDDEAGGPTISPEDMQRCEDFAEMCKEAHLDVVMAESERRVSLAKTIFLHVNSDSIEAIARAKPDAPRTRVMPFWPSDVLVLPHPQCPTSLTTALAVMLRVSDEGGIRGKSTTWQVWTRSFEEDEAGNVTGFGPWRTELVTESKRTFTDALGRMQEEMIVDVKPIVWRTPDGTSDVYPLPTLPIIEWHDGVADGSPFLDVDRNLVGMFDTINASMMSEQFAVDFCAATPIIRKSDDTLNNRIALGPGMMTRIPKDDDVVPVNVGADFAGIRAAAQALVDSLALTNRMAPSSFNAENSQAPTSGVALKIKNEAQAKARLEKVARAIEVEARLLAVMIEVHDYWRATSIADDGITACMEPKDPPEYEDQQVTQRRAIDARDAGLISDVECRVLCGYSRTEEDARAALKKINAQKATNPAKAALEAAAGMNKQQRLEAEANGIPGGDPSAIPVPPVQPIAPGGPPVPMNQPGK